ncbi:MAG: hypothetical protein K5694_05295 [Bacilli bacterium]|nr:hypothetical protein [Bacilli bacterium]
MDNKNIILLRHHPMNVKYTNPFYLNQVDDLDLSEYMVIDVTSRVERDKKFMAEHPNFSKEISPFFIGPVISSDGVKANVFEIFWQCGKVYPCHDKDGVPNEEFFKWRNEYYSKEKCTKDLMRHSCKSLGYEHKDTLYFAYYDKDKNLWEALNYVESRKRVYFVEYAKLIYNTESFKWLKSLVEDKKKIALVDFDAMNIYSPRAKNKAYLSYLNKCEKTKIEPSLKEEDFQRLDNMKDYVSCPFLAVGHATVIKALLEGDIEVIDGEVIDRYNILK